MKALGHGNFCTSIPVAPLGARNWYIFNFTVKTFTVNSHAYPTTSHESSPAWEWICISTGCPARGEALAFVINAEAEGREDLQPQEG